VRLPLKALAVRSGLADYGRNNIAYIQGLGSFFQLAAFYSDLPCEGDTWREPQMMEICQKCDACLRKCPTQAILPDRFLIRAEKCLTFHNERGPEYPFPEWIEPNTHNFLIGCMICQRFCPVNKSIMKWTEGDVTFDHAETRMFMKRTPLDRLPAETVEKLRQLDLIDSLEILPRNLRVYLN
jgi:epoxyqueuosine reductase